MASLLLSMIVLLFTLSLVEGIPVILSPPRSVNASLNTVVQFDCTCHYCVGQFWKVNGVSASQPVNHNKGITTGGPTQYTNGSKYYTLSMPATVQLNESSVQCVIYNGSSYPRSDLVYLLVQGILSEVVNLQVKQISFNSLFITYSPLHTLIGVPILHYEILLNEGMLLGVNVTGLECTLNVSDICITYSISVSGWNDVGKGNSTDVSEIIFYQIPQITQQPLKTTQHNNFGTLEAYIHFQFNSTCIGTFPRSLSFVIDQQQYNCSLIDSYTSNCTVINGNVTVNLTDLLHYGTIHHVNMTLSTISSKSITYNFTINTYHVIGARIIVSTGQIICVECSFRLRSPSSGCTVLFHDTSYTDRIYTMVINKQFNGATDCHTTLPNGVYSLTVLDNEAYELGNTNNTAVSISRLVTISRPISTVILSSSSTIVYSGSSTIITSSTVPLSSVEATLLSSTLTQSTTFVASTLPTVSPSVSNNKQLSMGTEGDNSVLIIAISSTAGVMTCLLIIVASVLTIYLVKEKRKSHIHKIIHEERMKHKESNDIILQCTTTVHDDTVTNMQACLAYDTLPIPPPPLYETVPSHLPPRQ